MEDEEIEKNEEIEMPDKPDYSKELIEIIRSDLSAVQKRERLTDYHENDIADALEELTVEERKTLYRILGNEVVSEIFAYLDDVGRYLNELDSEKAADIIESMDADDAVDVLEELGDDKREEIINLIDEEARHDIELIDSYDDNEIGSKMTTNFIVIKKGLTVKGAMKELITQAAENDNISNIYVVEDDDTFYGVIDLKDLIVARDFVELETLISTSYPYVYATESTEECIAKIKEYSEDSIPVLDNDNKILGVITALDIIEEVDAEMGEDYVKFAGLTAEEDLKEPLFESIKKRIPWLLILLVLGLLVSAVVGIFENVVSRLSLIVAFQSLILDMAGNVGTQSLAVTIRVLTDEELSFGQKLSFVGKEVRVGAFNGFVLGSISFLMIGLYVMLFKGKPPVFAFAVSSCIAIALLLAMIISSLMGTVIPMIFKKMKVDPAVASGPLITTVNDLVAVVTYYGLAWILLLNVLGLVE